MRAPVTCARPARPKALRVRPSSALSTNRGGQRLSTESIHFKGAPSWRPFLLLPRKIKSNHEGNSGNHEGPCRRNPSCNLPDLCGCHCSSPCLCVSVVKGFQRAHVPRIKAFPRLLYSSAMLQDTLEEGREGADRALERL